jgi:hypothetical protein
MRDVPMNVMWTCSWLYVFGCGAGGSKTDSSVGIDSASGESTSGALCVDDDFLPVVPRVDFEFNEFEGYPLLMHVPDTPRGVVFIFHGSGGEIGFLTAVHYMRTWNLYTDAGFAVVGTESTNREQGTWSSAVGDVASNPDMDRLVRLRDHLMDTTPLQADTPVYGWGFSNGGGFLDAFAWMGEEERWPMAGLMIHNSALGSSVELPVLITSSENDAITNLAEQTYEAHEATGWPAEWWENKERPWTREDMQIHPAYDATDSEAVFEDLVGFGFIDADGNRLLDLNELESSMNYYSRNSALPGPDRVTPLLRVIWATHRPTSEFACEEVAFIKRHLP